MRIHTVLNVAILALLIGERAEAQASPGRETLVILAGDRGGADARAAIFVRLGETPAVIIDVPEKSVTEEDLAEAFRVMHHLRKEAHKGGHAAGTLLRVDLSGPRTGRPLNADERRAYAGYIRSFPKAPIVDVPGVGRGRAVEVQMPNWP